MSIRIFQDNIFPRHVSDLLNLMHQVIFTGTDGEESWNTYLSPRQKEHIALGLAQYYQCEHCIQHHLAAIHHLEKNNNTTVSQNIISMILFLRIDSRTIGKTEKDRWIDAWQRFSQKVSVESNDQAIPHLIGLAIGVARNDDFLIQFCGDEVKKILSSKGIDVIAAIGELEAVVIFMKAAVSKNRVTDKVGALLNKVETTE